MRRQPGRDGRRRGRAAVLALLLSLTPAQAVGIKLRPQSPQIEQIILDLLKRLSSSSVPLTLDKSSGTVFVISDPVGAPAAPLASAVPGIVPPSVLPVPAAGTVAPAVGVPLPGNVAAAATGTALATDGTGTGGPASSPTVPSGVAFNPDVSSRTLTVAGTRRVEFNPQGPVSLKDAVEAEFQKELGLSALTPEAAQLRFSGADLNGDGKIDTADLAILMGNFGQSGGNLRGDLNGDGRVDDLDVELFSAQYRLP